MQAYGSLSLVTAAHMATQTSKLLGVHAALSVYTDESVHSTRRGTMIHRQQHMQTAPQQFGEAAV